MRAHYARRLGHEAEARGFDRARGCPDRWFVAGAYGSLPRLDLVDAASPPTVTAIARGCAPSGCAAAALTLEAEHGRAGVLYGVQWFHAARATEALLVVDTDAAVAPLRRRRAGLRRALARSRAAARAPPPAAARRPAGTASRSRSPPSAGAPRPSSALVGRPAARAVADGDAAQAPRDGRARPSTAARSARACPRRATRTDRALVDFLAAHAAFRAGDGDAGEAALARLSERAPRFAPAQLLAAQLWSEDSSRPSRLARDRGRRALERALALDPTLDRARYNLALIELNGDKPREALARLDELKRSGDGDRSWRFAFARQQALKQRGWQREADEALAEARRRDPEACPALEADVQRRRERHDVRGALALARQASVCDGGSDELADLLRATRRSRRAPSPSTGGCSRSIRCASRGAPAWPRRWRSRATRRTPPPSCAQLVARYPRAAHYRRELADTLFALGQAAARAPGDRGRAWPRRPRARSCTARSPPVRSSAKGAAPASSIPSASTGAR